MGWGGEREQLHLSEPDGEGAMAGPCHLTGEWASLCSGCLWGLTSCRLQFGDFSLSRTSTIVWLDFSWYEQSGPCRSPWEERSEGKDPGSPLLLVLTERMCFWRRGNSPLSRRGWVKTNAPCSVLSSFHSNTTPKFATLQVPSTSPRTLVPLWGSSSVLSSGTEDPV